jgi:hypothetical protein
MLTYLVYFGFLRDDFPDEYYVFVEAPLDVDDRLDEETVRYSIVSRLNDISEVDLYYPGIEEMFYYLNGVCWGDYLDRIGSPSFEGLKKLDWCTDQGKMNLVLEKRPRLMMLHQWHALRKRERMRDSVKLNYCMSLVDERPSRLYLLELEAKEKLVRDKKDEACLLEWSWTGTLLLSLLECLERIRDVEVVKEECWTAEDIAEMLLGLDSADFDVDWELLDRYKVEHGLGDLKELSKSDFVAKVMWIERMWLLSKAWKTFSFWRDFT